MSTPPAAAVPGLPDTGRAARAAAAKWLAHLRRDSRGLPVPWINRWGPETAAATRVDYDPTVGQPAIFHDDHGDTPDFLRQNIGRQRAAMVGGLCQVCGRPVPWSRRNLVISGVSCETVTVTDPDSPGGVRQAVAVTEPWLDDRCAAIAVHLCPALIRREHAADLHVTPVRSRRDAQLVLSVGNLADLPGSGAERARLAPFAGRPLGMWVKVVLTGRHTVLRPP